MKVFSVLLLCCLANLVLTGQELRSPSGEFSLQTGLSPEGAPTFSLSYQGKPILQEGKLGFILKDLPAFDKGFRVKSQVEKTRDTTWETVWGENRLIRDHYREWLITYEQQGVSNRELDVRFRIFDDGLAFRYEFREQAGLRNFAILDELSSWRLTGDHQTFWIPGDFDSNEYAYSTTPLSQIDAFSGKKENGIGLKTILYPNLVQTPLMMKTASGVYISLHEAALVAFPAMHLEVDRSTFRLKAHLVPDVLGNKAYIQAPAVSPWRTFIISSKPEKILESNMILNLNDPCRYSDVSWIKPQKFIGIWWGMHVGTMSWNYADATNIRLDGFDWSRLKPNGTHGATTENTMRYIDFAAENGFDGVLVEGWNVGWEDWWGGWKEEVFDFVTPYPDFDMEKVTRYAQELGVKLIMHHETSSSVANYERRMDEAYRLMEKYGYQTVKTGYVGRIIPRGEYHDGQWMVNHYVRVARKLGERHMMLDAHEPVRPTGLHRTYPNWMACEAARGNEFNAWSMGNPPEHETILPFTRLMGGPMDYTPGIFQITMDAYNPAKKERVHTTLAKQLALYVTMYSPLQMAADLPENYQKFPDAFQFIRDVPVDWEVSRVLSAEPGDHVVYARKDRNSGEWYLGAITDEKPLNLPLRFDFLPENSTYVATVYADAPDAHWETNPMAYVITRGRVDSKSTLTLKLAAGGGVAISLKPADRGEIKGLKSLQ